MRIDLNLLEKNGARGNNIKDFINNQKIYDTLLERIGRIFVIGRDELYWTGSGIIKDKETIITAVHVIELDYQDQECYFVPASMLNLNTGFPDKVVNTKQLSDFLRKNANSSSNNVRLITTATAKKHTPSILSGRYKGADHKPFYSQNEDTALCTIQGVEFVLQNSRPIDFLRNISDAPKRIFSIGFPVSRHLDPSQHHLSEHLGALAPLTLTSNTTSQNPNSKINNEILYHDVPAVGGMSGGPVFTLEQNSKHEYHNNPKLPLINQYGHTTTINVIGNVARGEGDNEEACILG